MGEGTLCVEPKQQLPRRLMETGMSSHTVALPASGIYSTGIGEHGWEIGAYHQCVMYGIPLAIMYDCSH